MVNPQVSSTNHLLKVKAKLGKRLRTNRVRSKQLGGIRQRTNRGRIRTNRGRISARNARGREGAGAHAAVVGGAPGVDRGDRGAAGVSPAADAIVTGAALAAGGAHVAYHAGATVAAPAVGGEAQVGAAGAGGDGGPVAALVTVAEAATIVVVGVGAALRPRDENQSDGAATMMTHPCPTKPAPLNPKQGHLLVLVERCRCSLLEPWVGRHHGLGHLLRVVTAGAIAAPS